MSGGASLAGTRGQTGGILLVLIGVACISVNDMLVKALSGDYALHQIVFLRSSVGIFLTLALLRAEGGLHLLATPRPGLHALRALLLVAANMTFSQGSRFCPLRTPRRCFSSRRF